MKIPKGHQPLMPYLILKNAEAFITFTKTVFNAIEMHKSYRNNDALIMHAELQINGCNIMLADVTDNFEVANANLFIYVENADTTFAIALKNGASIITDLADQSYGRSGGVQDPFGNVWWITSLK